jgi:hypothetical protein
MSKNHILAIPSAPIPLLIFAAWPEPAFSRHWYNIPGIKSLVNGGALFQ